MRRPLSLALSALLLPGTAEAHFFVQPYTLPVPFELYAYGAALALVLSFVVIGWMARRSTDAHDEAPAATADAAAPRPGLGWWPARAVALGLLLLCIASGYAGTQNPFRNINMTLFWVVFVLALPYAVALAGDFYAPANPWLTVVDALARTTGLRFGGRVQRPERVGYAPALLLYGVFIWLELFGKLTPRGLATALLVYTGINIVGAWTFGREAWFVRGEFFGVMLRLLGRMSAWARPWDPGAREGWDGRRWRAPFSGLRDERVHHMSLVLFVLFMLSSTAYDGLHATLPWAQLFWKFVYPELAPWFPAAPGRTYAVSVQLYYGWQWLWLSLSPLVYLAVFLSFLWIARWTAGGRMKLRPLAMRFTMSLLPIAFVYHVTHYYTLLLVQGGQIVRLASDPLGLRWNLFGTAALDVRPLMLDVEWIWHTQIALILLGHIVGVHLAHLEALKVFPTSRQATVSQLPMLALMVLFTTFGLWILSLPLAGG